jgi:hypothetical protein
MGWPLSILFKEGTQFDYPVYARLAGLADKVPIRVFIIISAFQAFKSRRDGVIITLSKTNAIEP